MKTGYKLSHGEKKIIVSKDFLVRSGCFGTPEFDEMSRLRVQFPNYMVEEYQIEKNPNKQTYGKPTYGRWLAKVTRKLLVFNGVVFLFFTVREAVGQITLDTSYDMLASLVIPFIEDQNTISDFIYVSSDTSLRLNTRVMPNISTDGSFPKTWKFEKSMVAIQTPIKRGYAQRT